jgi:hypothetical protein
MSPQLIFLLETSLHSVVGSQILVSLQVKLYLRQLCLQLHSLTSPSAPTDELRQEKFVSSIGLMHISPLLQDAVEMKMQLLRFLNLLTYHSGLDFGSAK